MKKGYKRLQRRLLNETYKRIEQEQLKNQYKAVAINAEEEAEYYKDRFRKFGSNVETVEPTGKLVECLKWTVEQQPWGQYAKTDKPGSDDWIAYVHKWLTERLVKGLMDRNIVQFIDSEEGPFGSVYAVKLYVVPWEQMPHARTIELQQYVDGIKNEMS